VLSLFGIFPILSFLSLIGTFAIFSYLAVTERNAPKFTYLPREDVSHKIEDPKVTVVVTAKNEEELIEKCLDSLTRQTYSSLEIIVVDDSSTDSTREIVEKLASNHSNLRLVSAGLKTPGWVGKSWPCWRGFEESGGCEFLLFVDADSTFEKTVVERTVLYAYENSIDMFSLSPRVVLHGIWAKAVLPLITGAINLLYPMSKVNDKSSKRAYVFGTYFLVRKSVYEKTRGHCKVRDQLVEDAAIAQLVKSAGYNLRVERGPEFLSTEWESDRKAIFNGLERVFSSSIKNYGMKSILNAILLFFLIIYPIIYFIADVLVRSFSEFFLLGTVASLLSVAILLALTSFELNLISGGIGPGVFLFFLGGLIFISAIVTTSVKVARGKDLYWKGQGYKQNLEQPLEKH
jgi:chlorobactene glucosyltransferase